MLNLYKLEIFAIVVQAGSFSGAAERLLMSQPAVSQHIQDLEAALGTVLFERGRRGVRLTQAGATLHEYTRAIFQLVAEAENAVVDVKKLTSGQVTVGATPGVSVYLLPDWIHAFMTAYPNLTVSVQTSITPDIVRDLRSGRMDLSFVEGELDDETDERLGVAPLETFDQLVVVGPRHPWWARAEIGLADLNDQSFVMRQRNSQTRIWLDGMMQEHRIRPRVAAEFDNVESIKRAVVNGAGLTILPEYAVRGEVEAGKLRALPIAGSPLRRVLKLVWHRETYRSPVVRSFVRFLRRYLPALEGVQV
jgi:DNA-binding transcriptional LysR family regulator